LLASSKSINFFGKRVLRRASVVTTVSSVLARTITERTGVVVESDAIRPMPIVDIDRPRSQGGGGVIMLGRLTDQKRVDLALEGYASARDRGLKLPLRIVGDGPARASLQVHAGGLGLKDSVTFVGAVQPEDVPNYLATADLCLMTAKDEGLGLAAAEALVQGIPVVGCEDGGGLLDVVRLGAGGVVVAPSAEAIGGALLAAIEDRQLHADAAEAGKGWQARLSPAAVAECCEEWYRQALEARL
jgi:1,2-diacylglycerol 3-alpha-glucosyltransferase